MSPTPALSPSSSPYICSQPTSSNHPSIEPSLCFVSQTQLAENKNFSDLCIRRQQRNRVRFPGRAAAVSDRLSLFPDKTAPRRFAAMSAKEPTGS